MEPRVAIIKSVHLGNTVKYVGGGWGLNYSVGKADLFDVAVAKLRSKKNWLFSVKLQFS